MILKRTFIMLCVLSAAYFQSASAQSSQTYNTSGTWTCPSNVTFVTVESWGGGGGGGGSSSNNSGGSGGGSGAYVKKVGIKVTPGNNYTVTVGGGGSAGSGTTPTLIAGGGGYSYFYGNDYTVKARGGCGALGNRGAAGVGGCSNGTTSTCININTCNPSFNDGVYNFLSVGNTGNTGGYGTGAAGASAPYGGSGGLARTTDGNGNNGSQPGGGGGGGLRKSYFNRNGGAGAAGRVKIWWPSEAPSIGSVTPACACAGGSVTITGTSYGCYLGINMIKNVTFNGITASSFTITSVSGNNDYITAIIASGTPTGTGLICLTNGIASSCSDFTVTSCGGCTDICSLSISSNPNPATVCYGNSVTFSVTPDGSATAPVSYQWYKDDNPIGSLTTGTSFSASTAGSYKCVATNCSSGIATSNEITLSLNTIPVITNNPLSTAKCIGNTVIFSTDANGTTPLSYTWLKDGNPLSVFSNQLTLENITSLDSGEYYCIVSNLCGSASSSLATLTVNIPPDITQQASGSLQCIGNDITFSISANGTSPLSYEWYNGVVELGITNHELNLGNTNEDDIGNYYCKVTNLCGTKKSNVWSLTKCCFSTH